MRVHAAEERAQAAAMRKAVVHNRVHTLSMSLFVWAHVTLRGQAKRTQQAWASRWIQQLRLRHCLASWHAAVATQQQRRRMLVAAEAHANKHLMQLALLPFKHARWLGSVGRWAAAQHRRNMQTRLLRWWYDWTQVKHAERAVLQHMHVLRLSRARQQTFYAWRAHVDGRLIHRMQEERDR
jgi:hypothetical protein